VPPSLRAEHPPDATPRPVPPTSAEQESGCAAERGLVQLGRSPAGSEEFAAMEERHAFLAEQLEDLKATRRDLLDIVREVDERVEQVFTAAYHDTAAAVRAVFARLFPGGEGRLVLTDPVGTCSPPGSRSRPAAGQEGQAAVAAVRRASAR
jgi:chromosome segregation protein